jgi:hypothetical protein
MRFDSRLRGQEEEGSSRGARMLTFTRARCITWMFAWAVQLQRVCREMVYKKNGCRVTFVWKHEMKRRKLAFRDVGLEDPLV